MAERYSKVFSAPENFYAIGAPVVIAAGALLRDNASGKVLAQLKFLSVSGKRILALTVRITARDTAGRRLGKPVEQKYLDLNARIGEDFGSKLPVALPDAASRAFSAEVVEAVFDDGTVWTGTEAPWEPLKAQHKLDLGEDSLNEQFRIRYGENCQYALLKQKDLWHCACGAVNKDSVCHACGLKLDELEAVDYNALRADRDERLKEEKEVWEKKTAAKQVKAKRIKKAAIVAGIVVAVTIGAVTLVREVSIRNAENQALAHTYEMAEACFAKEEYEKASELFASLGDYKDSAAKYEESRNAWDYQRAMACLESGDAEEAYRLLSSLGNYKDASSYYLDYRLVKMTSYHPNGNLSPITLVDTYSYDEDGRIIRSVHNPNGENAVTTYSYDAEGVMTSIEKQSSDSMGYTITTSTKYNSNGDPESQTQVCVYKKGDGTEQIDWQSDDTYAYVYNEDGTIASEEYVSIYKQRKANGEYKYEEYNHFYTYQYTYDENGNIQTVTNNYGDKQYTYEYVYNDIGVLIEKNDQSGSGWQYTYKYEYFLKH